ncbi:MAG: pyridoxamine 5'-phosphate oxidase family protein [Candidatus Parabeggiatoa sp. nov. 2]|nr:MAG: pyridoxamine 5'-phosphate oxidase [Beggiatoa sp. 4572_84]RKZ57183.1 MAG: pyridoxamine 5'-phosphate oxidase family protein [Gammaproteobacteria bacterium]
MAKRYTEISEKLQQFIKQQQIFFVGTAASEGRVNVSPKGMDSFRILSPNKVVWLNLTGSGNETAAHLIENDRMTIMFCAFEGNPLILRLYGYANVFHQRDLEWNNLISLFPPQIGARQIIEVNVDLVQTSCGAAVPRFEFVEEREQLKQWLEKKGPEGVRAYWKDRNQVSLDGKPTKI